MVHSRWNVCLNPYAWGIVQTRSLNVMDVALFRVMCAFIYAVWHVCSCQCGDVWKHIANVNIDTHHRRAQNLLHASHRVMMPLAPRLAQHQRQSNCTLLDRRPKQRVIKAQK